MAYATINADTAKSSDNLLKEGRAVEVQLLEAFGDLPAGTAVHLGVLAPGAKVSPTVSQDTEDVLGQDEETGQDIVLDTVITATSVTYDEIPVVTPDDTVMSLLVGAPPAVIADGPLAGTKIYPFAIGASLKVALTVLRRRAGSDIVRVYWHPETGLQSAESQDGNAGTEIKVARATVKAWSGSIKGAILLAYNGKITKYGAVFEVHKSKLNALQEELADEAMGTAATA